MCHLVNKILLKWLSYGFVSLCWQVHKYVFPKIRINSTNLSPPLRTFEVF